MFSDNALLTSEKWSIFKTTRRKEQFLGPLAMLAVNKEEEKTVHIGVISKKNHLVQKLTNLMHCVSSTVCLITYLKTPPVNKKSNYSRRYITKCSYLKFY